MYKARVTYGSCTLIANTYVSLSAIQPLYLDVHLWSHVKIC